ncbi:MAG: TrmH family RNA methyltransferase [Oscillospiraceae bacterium]
MRHNSNQSEIHPFPEGYPQEGLLEGRNALQEALRSGRTIDKVWVAAGDTDRNLARLTSEAKEQGAVVIPVDRRKLDNMSITHAHQGVIALAAARPYATLDDIFALAESRGEAPLIVVCDELSDPHNLGAIIRSAECAGAHGVVIPKRRSAGLTPVVAKASAGAIEYMPVARVSNISSALKELQARGVWVYGTAADGTQGSLTPTRAHGHCHRQRGRYGTPGARPVMFWCGFPCVGVSPL